MPKATTRSTGSHAGRNPISPRPIPLAGDLQRKTGPGWRRPAASLTGPAIQEPTINAQAQSAVSDRASFSEPIINRGEGTNTKVIDRASIELPSAYGDNPAGGVEVP